MPEQTAAERAMYLAGYLTALAGTTRYDLAEIDRAKLKDAARFLEDQATAENAATTG
jgi:hypothetical protein